MQPLQVEGWGRQPSAWLSTEAAVTIVGTLLGRAYSWLGCLRGVAVTYCVVVGGTRSFLLQGRSCSEGHQSWLELVIRCGGVGISLEEYLLTVC